MDLLKELHKDVRFAEGLKSCINCGICTAVCPAAQFFNYDPRIIVVKVQEGNEAELEQLLKSDTIWYCGECLSCKTRCPRNNVPGYIIQSLRSLSVKTGFFAESLEGQKQRNIISTVGEHILKYGYCVYIDEVDTEMYPEQGPVWDWFKQNRQQMLERLGTNYKKRGSGTLRQIPDESLKELRRIFEETGAAENFERIETLTSQELI